MGKSSQLDSIAMFDYQIWQQMDVIFIDLAAKDIKGPRISMAFFTMDHPSGPPVAMIDMSLEMPTHFHSTQPLKCRRLDGNIK